MTRRVLRPGSVARSNKRTGLPIGETPRQQTERLQWSRFQRAIKNAAAGK